MSSITFCSAKGGVGKTTLTANVGAALATEFNKDVLLVDGNITGSNLGFHFGINHPKKTIADLRDEDVEKIIYTHASGVKIIPGSVDLDSRLDPNSLETIVDAVGNDFDFVLIDSAPSMGREAVSSIAAAESVVCVTTPYIPCVHNTSKTLEFSHKMGKKSFGLIVNEFTRKSFELNDGEIRALCGNARILGKIPRSDEISKSIAMQTPLVILKPNHPISQEFKRIAGVLSGEHYYPPSLFGRLKGIFSLKEKSVERPRKEISLPGKKQIAGKLANEVLDVERLKTELVKEIRDELRMGIKEDLRQELAQKLKQKLKERGVG